MIATSRAVLWHALGETAASIVAPVGAPRVWLVVRQHESLISERPQWVIAVVPEWVTAVAADPHVWWLVGVVLVLAATVLGLLIARRRLRMTEVQAILVAEISSRFVNLPSGEVDREIEEAQRRLCTALDLDSAVLWQVQHDDPGRFLITHRFRGPGAPEFPRPLTERDFPWTTRELMAGRFTLASSLSEHPPEAAADVALARRIGVKSHVTIPLIVGGARPIGVLAFHVMRKERQWRPAVVARLLLVAQIFANALARKRADEALRLGEARLAAGVELAGLGYYEIDYGARWSFLDDRARDVWGVPADVQEGLQPVDYWTAHVHPDNHPAIVEMHGSLLPGAIDRASAEYRYLHPTKGVRWIQHLARIVTRGRDGSGPLTVGVVRDITSEKEAQREVLELHARLSHVGRVNVLGQLATALAHELSQPLGAILRNAEAAELMLRAPAPDLEELRAIVTDIHEDDRRGSLVIDRLRSLLKRRVIELRPLGLPAVIHEVLALVRADAASRQVRLVSTIAADIPPVAGDRIHLQQVLLNLLVNAMDAIAERGSDGGCIEVSARRATPVTIEVRVADDGPGLPADRIEQLFEAFYTTKDKGMGMGLAVSKTIIEAHKGRLWAENRPERGACFTFSLPVAGPETLAPAGRPGE
ncbi:MAG: GAF domain-containing protein [Opitutaceae bacterium]|nr:GAF domain-containing protein [Opitutaceae bacterium]